MRSRPSGSHKKCLSFEIRKFHIVPSYKIIQSEFTAWAEAWADTCDGEKFHAVLCDPPYGLEFMGKDWDSAKYWDKRRNTESAKLKGTGSIRNAPTYAGGNSFQSLVTFWGEALLPLLYPGALVFMFGGTRMWHRLAAGMENAGFILWDTLMWIHGQGFPKAQDISKLIDRANGNEREVVGTRKGAGGENLNILSRPNGNDSKTAKSCGKYGVGAKSVIIDIPVTIPGSEQSAPWVGHKTCALKPAWEPILAFRAPADGKNYAELAMEFGSGSLNVDAGRIGSKLRRMAHARHPADIQLGLNLGRLADVR